MQAILYVKKWYGRSTKSGLLKGATFGSAVALAATAGLANAADDDLNTLVMAGFYEILDDGRAVFKAENGQDLYLSAEQYVILEGGLLLVSGELAEPVFNSLQVAGALRAQLINGTALVRDTSGDQVATAEEEPLWSGDGPAEMPSEEEQDAPDDVTVQEVVTASAGGLGFAALIVLTSRQVAPVPEIINPVVMVVGDTGPNTGTIQESALSDYVTWTDGNDDIETFQLSSPNFDPVLSPATADGILSGNFDSVVNSGTTYWEAKQRPLFVKATDSTGLTGTAKLYAAGQLILPDALVADAESVTIKGADGDDYVGYWAATSAATSPLTNFGRGIGRDSTVDLGNGSNFLRLGHEAVNGGVFTYTGGTGEDTIRVADKFANWNGDATLNMSAGGKNTLNTGDSPAVSGDMTYVGGAGTDTLNMGRWFGNNQSNVLLDMREGGTNQLTAMWMAAVSGNEFTYLGGSGSDTLTFGMHFGANNGDIEIDMSRGGRNEMQTTDLAVTASNTSASMTYIGGADTDTLSFGNTLGSNGGSVSFDMSLGGSNTLNTMNFPGLSGTLSYLGGAGTDDINMWDYVGNNGGSVTIDFSAGGENEFTAGAFAAQSGQLTYTGGGEGEDLTFGAYLAANSGTASFSLAGGGDNTFIAGHDAARSGNVEITAGWGDDLVNVGDYTATHNGDLDVDLGAGINTFQAGSWFAHSGTFTYNGSSQGDNVSFGDYSAAKSGTITLYMGSGINTLDAGSHVAHSGTFVYKGTHDRDDLDFGDALAIWGGDAQINAGRGYNTFDAGSNVAQTGQLAYVGGSGIDELSFGTGLVENGGTATLDLGFDTAADKIVFYGSVADTVGTCTIENFDPLYDTIDVPHSSFTISATGSGACEVASSAGTHFSFTVNAVTVSDLTNAII